MKLITLFLAIFALDAQSKLQEESDNNERDNGSSVDIEEKTFSLSRTYFF